VVFSNRPIALREVDRFVVEDAREWIRGPQRASRRHHPSRNGDRLRLSVLDTFDTDLIKLSGRLGLPRLTIGRANMSHTEDMFLEEKQVMTAHDEGARRLTLPRFDVHQVTQP
jgi:hypothetical protein